MDARQRREVKLRWGDEGVASQQHLAPEPSLNGDLTSRVVRAVMRSMDGAEIPTCMLSFERSPSPHYGAAVRLARSLPGYEYRGEGRHERHSVPIGLSALPLAERLLALVQGWRSTVVTTDGAVLDALEIASLLLMLRCYRRRARSGLGALYCWGLPERARGRVPCRLVDAALPWMLPEEYERPTLLPRLLHAHARTTFAALCPAFSLGATWSQADGPADEEARQTVERLLGDLELDLDDA